jgi:hypothetical protein
MSCNKMSGINYNQKTAGGHRLDELSMSWLHSTAPCKCHETTNLHINTPPTTLSHSYITGYSHKPVHTGTQP